MKIYFFTLIGIFCFISIASPETVNFPGPIEEHEFIEGEVLVRWRDVSEKLKLQSLGNVGVTDRHQDYVVPNLELVTLEEGRSTEDAVKSFEQDPNILYAEPNYVVYANMGFFPPPKKFPSRRDPNLRPGIPRTGPDPLLSRNWGIEKIMAPTAWQQGTGNKNIIIAVIDTGIDYNHEDLWQNLWFNPGEIAGNGLDDDNNSFVDDVIGWDFANNDAFPYDDNRHGTHVSGIAGARGFNGTGITGVSPVVSIMVCKFLDSRGAGNIANAVRALSYAVMNGAKVLNNSWGGDAYSRSLEDAIAVAERAGVTFVAAAGNDFSRNNDQRPSYPASYRLSNVVAVASTNQVDQLSRFSSIGPTSIHLAAPGEAIYSALPKNQYGVMSGTSMASPFVAGAVALMLAKNFLLTPQQIRTLLMEGVDPVPDLQGKVVSGGRLNVKRTLDLVPIQPSFKK